MSRERVTETHAQFPLLQLFYDPLAPHPVVVSVPIDWSLTGEIYITYTSVASLRDALRVLDFASNAVADEVHLAEKEIHEAEARKKKDPPFKVG